MLFLKRNLKKIVGNIVSIDIYCQVSGVPTSDILKKKLYFIKKRTDIEIIHSLQLRKMNKMLECKADNYIIFNLQNGKTVQADMDPDGKWIRIITVMGAKFYSMKGESVKLLLNHLQKAKILYEKEFNC